jgi:hypothetical protein
MVVKSSILSAENLSDGKVRVLSNHALAGHDGIAETVGHDLVSVDQGEKEAQILLRPAQVVSEGGAPGMAIGLKRILEVTFFEGGFKGIGRVNGGPASWIDVLGTGCIEAAGGSDEERAIGDALVGERAGEGQIE